MLKRIATALLAVAMVVNVIPTSTLSVRAEETSTSYEIYPTPHSVEYKDGSFAIGSDVNVVFESGIDEVTKNKLDAVLEDNGIEMNATDVVAESKTNILVGVKDSDEYVDTYADQNVTYKDTTFAENHYDAYVLDINNGTITVLGDTTDGAFYGIVSLMHILDQLDGGKIRNLTIDDYADTSIRGFIEGYYGIPWSNEDRMSLMEFGGQFKMTCYVFAPKDDPYHTSKWRELYPDTEIAEIQKMVEVGNNNKCRFVWTAHPFMGGFNSNDVNGEIQSLLAKFEQLYKAGVRQFGVLGDDVGSLNRSVVIQVMTAVSEWANEKGDVYDSVFCPAGYNHSWQGDYSELNDYDAGFPDDVQIFWTGEAVCQPVEVKTLDHFRNNNATNGSRRAPLFWLNWPVNDINSARMLMGKGSLLHTDVDPADLVGVVTNPMQEAEASKVALFAVADYAWNVKDFDDDQSWEDCFKYIDPDASEALHTLAKHMSDPAPNGHGLVLEESEELQPLLDSYQEKLKAGTLTEADHKALLAQFQTIADACDEFHTKSKNANLKDELLPFTTALKEKALAAIEYIQTQKAVDNGDEVGAWSHYSQATAYLASSKVHTKELLSGGSTNVTPGSKRITPFVETLSTTLSPIVNAMIDDSKVITTYITNRTDAPATGSVDNILDGDVASSAIYKTPNKIAEGDYVGVKYSKNIEIQNIRFVLGAGKDHFDQGKLQYTEDGTTWKDMELVGIDNVFTGVQGQVQDVTVEKANLPENFKAMGIRFVATKDNAADAWLEVREIMINAVESDDEAVEVYNGTVFVTEGFEIYQGSVSDVTDESDSTFVWYKTPNNTVTAGQYVGLDLGSEVEIGAIHFAMPSGDCLSDYTLQYSVDGTTYTDIQRFTTLTADVDLSGQNITARYIRAYNNVETSKWLKVAAFSVSEPVIRETVIFTNKENVTGFTNNVTEDTAVLTGTASVTYAPGEYVGIDLGRIKDITDITVEGAGTLTLEVSKNNVVWTAIKSDAYEDARYIRLINNSKTDVTAQVASLTVLSNEIQPISVLATNFGNTDTHLNAFDNDRTSEAVLQASQVAGQYITYDLGQVINLDSLKLVLHDGTTDYPRHAKVSVSTDNKTWTDVMVIGNQDSDNEGEADNTDNIKDLFPVHEISYYTLEETGINQSVRYVKFELTRTKSGADKWVRIREIELNGGNMYLPESNDPTIVTDAAESKGNVALNMLDGDLSTTFQPVDNKAGYFTYSISEQTEIKRINILQSPALTSDAEVRAEVVVDGVVKNVELGTLSSSFNKFNTSAYDNVLSITVTWKEGKAPCIHEIITLSTIDAGEDKSALYDYYNEVKDTDTSNWTDASVQEFNKAMTNAEKVLANNAATAEEIKAALDNLKAAIDNKTEKPVTPDQPDTSETPADKEDKQKAETYLEECKGYYEEEHFASTEEWEAYQKAVAALEELLTKETLTQEELQAAIDAVKASVENVQKPVVPVEPEEPEVPGESEDPETPEQDDKDNVATGDTSSVMMWSTLLVMAVVVILMKKRMAK